MINIVIGFALGFVVATVGFSGIVEVLDQNVEAAKEAVEQIK